MSMNDSDGTFIVLVIVFVIGFVFGGITIGIKVRNNIRQDAVVTGHAHYTNDVNGASVWAWKPVKD